MREKYESLSLAALKDIAKARGMKGISAMKKEDVVNAMLRQDELDAQTDRGQAQGATPDETSGRQARGPKPESTSGQQARGEESDAVSGRQKRGSEPGTVSGRQARGPKPESTSGQQARGEESDAVSGRQKRGSEPGTVSGRQARGAEPGTAPGRQTRRGTDAQRGGAERPRQMVYRNPEAGRMSHSGSEEPAEAGDARREEMKREEGRREERRPETVQIQTAGQTTVQTAESAGCPMEKEALDSGVTANGILEVLPDGYGFIRSENYMPGENDVYVAPSQIRRFNLKTGDIIVGNTRIKTQTEKFSALLYIRSINGMNPNEAGKRCNFEDMTPIFPDERLKLETGSRSLAMRIMDLMSPVGKGQRGMIVSPPKAGKTTLLKEVAKSIKVNSPDMHLIILLIDERPEEVTDIKEAIEGPNVEVIYSTFDELPEHHKRVSEMVIERAKRLVEHKRDVTILLDSITRLTRAYNLTVPPSGRTLSGGLDPAALHMPKRFFGAARNMREGGSLTILATALVDTGSKMDDVVYEEFKGTGNMELVLDRKLSERRVFPAIDIPKSGTRREDLLLEPNELEAINIIRKALNGMKAEEAVERVIDLFVKTRNNKEFVEMAKKINLY